MIWIQISSIKWWPKTLVQNHLILSQAAPALKFRVTEEMLVLIKIMDAKSQCRKLIPVLLHPPNKQTGPTIYCFFTFCQHRIYYFISLNRPPKMLPYSLYPLYNNSLSFHTPSPT